MHTAKTVFDEHTPESFQELVDDLKALAAAGRVGERKTKEQTYGIKFEEDGLIFDPWTSRIANVPDSVYFDTQHNTLASGGFAQYEVNQFVRKILQLEEANITLADLDTWKRNIQIPKQGVTKLSGKWFQKRIVDKDGAHCRGYAGEILTAITVLCLFGNLYLREKGLLEEYIVCLERLKAMVDTFLTHDIALVDTLDAITAAHHQDFIRLYPDCVKLKPHYQVHVPRCAKKHGIIFSCFATERKNKFSKQIGSHCFKHIAHTITAYEVRHWLNLICDPNTFKPMHLAGNLHECTMNFEAVLPSLGGNRLVQFSSALATIVGTFSKGDIAFWRPSDGSEVCVGRIEGFHHVTDV